MTRVVRRAIAVCLIAVIVFSLLKALLTKPSAGSSKSVAALPARPDSYSLVMRSSNGHLNQEYVSGQRKRLEDFDENSGQSQTFIYRRDEGVSWTVKSDSKTVLELKYTPDVEAAYQAMAALVSWTEEGTEVVQGCKCTRFVGRYVPRAGAGYFFMGPGSAHEEMLIDESNGLPVRHVTYDRGGKAAAISERVTFGLDPPDSKLFEVPAGYTVERLEPNR